MQVRRSLFYEAIVNNFHWCMHSLVMSWIMHQKRLSLSIICKTCWNQCPVSFTLLSYSFLSCISQEFSCTCSFSMRKSMRTWLTHVKLLPIMTDPHSSNSLSQNGNHKMEIKRISSQAQSLCASTVYAAQCFLFYTFQWNFTADSTYISSQAHMKIALMFFTGWKSVKLDPGSVESIWLFRLL